MQMYEKRLEDYLRSTQRYVCKKIKKLLAEKTVDTKPIFNTLPPMVLDSKYMYSILNTARFFFFLDYQKLLISRIYVFSIPDGVIIFWTFIALFDKSVKRGILK